MTPDLSAVASNVPTRLVVVPVIRDKDGAVLLCKMPGDRGVYPGQWALPGGGVEPGERLVDALRREIREELGVELASARPLFFSDLEREKTLPGGERRLLYMVFLLFDCTVESSSIQLNDEFTEYAWVPPEQLPGYDLNAATRKTFTAMGLLPA
jgi:nucleoside triphosphatase